MLLQNVKLLNRNLRMNSVVTIPIRTITSRDFKVNAADYKVRIKYGEFKTEQEAENYKKEYLPTHWLSRYTEYFAYWINAPMKLKIFDLDKDTDFGKYQWNCNGGFPNRLANVLFRSKVLQTRGIMRFYIQRFEHRNTMDVNKAEEPPKITPNSVFLFRDNSNYILNRKSAERLAVFLLITQAWNIPTAVMYLYLALYFNIFQKVQACSRSMVTRMDLLPETEQLHIMKLGLFGFPRSILVNVNDLIKVDKEKDWDCIYIK